MSRWGNDDQALLEPYQSEAVLVFEHVIACAMRTLGSYEDALAWLRTEQPALNNERPLARLNSTLAAQAVVDLLNRIEHGVLS